MYSKRYFQNGLVLAEVSSFCSDGNSDEYNVMFHVTDSSLPFGQQLESVNFALTEICASIPDSSLVFRRYFISDAANQQMDVEGYSLSMGGAVSVVQQPPLDGTKVALWALLATDVQTEYEDGMFVVKHGRYSHCWTANKYVADGDSFKQTDLLLRDYAKTLNSNGMSIQNDCIRTWFFVQNVDVNYKGVVDARREQFLEYGLNKDTHYITSTGIGGRDANPEVSVKFDAYSVKGLDKSQISFLYARDFLNPTYEYNVTFERGVAVSYSDRKHLFLSGTASIDNKGDVVHIGDVKKQTERMWLNSDELLKEGGASIDDSSVMIVYLRDMADFSVVSKMYEQRFPLVPKVFLLAPVCRPGWLIEMETVAVVKHNANLPEF